jgi:hypothetical protein
MSSLQTRDTSSSRQQGSGDGDHRNNIFEFFRSHTAFDMLPESGKVENLHGFDYFLFLPRPVQPSQKRWRGLDGIY